MITQRFSLDVVPGAVPLIVHLKQYQTDVMLQFDLFSRLGDLTISATASQCKIRGTKKDGNGYSANATYSDYSVTVNVDEQMTAIAGMNPFEITLTDSTGQMITATFFLDVQRAALDADTVESESVIQEIENATVAYLEEHPEFAQQSDVVMVDTPVEEAPDITKAIFETSASEVDLVERSELETRVKKPDDNPNGTDGQVLRSNGDGTTFWDDYQMIDQSQVAPMVMQWIEAHPEIVADLSLSASSDGNGNVTLHLYGGD